jgi:hypothetical protein
MAFLYRLEYRGRDTSRSAGAWHRCTQLAPGDTIPRGPGTTLRVLAVRDEDADQPPVLVVEDMSRPATSN